MNTTICKILAVALLILIGGCATDNYSPQTEIKTPPRVNPKSCTACHNGNHAVDLMKFTPEQIEQKLNAFSNGRQDGYVMPKISKQMSDEEKSAISKALGTREESSGKQ